MARGSWTRTLSTSQIRGAKQRAREAARPYATGEKVESYFSPALIRKFGRHMAPKLAAKENYQIELNNSGVTLSGRRGSGDVIVARLHRRKLDPGTVKSRKIGGAKLSLRRKFDRDARGRFA